METRAQRLVVPALVALALAGLSLAGPLNPPSGAITSTGKTLTEVEPRIAINATNTPGDADSVYRITQPGSYYLTTNVAGVIGKHGIEIAADHVTIDLNGFTMFGVSGSLDGIGIPAVQAWLTVHNGTIRDWSGNGIGGGFTVTSGTIERVLVSNNVNIGIALNDNATIKDCSASACGTGMVVGSRSLMSGCRATFNTSFGLQGGFGSSILDSFAGNNSGIGIRVSDGGAVLDSTSFANQIGISAGSRCTVDRCTVTVSSTDGIFVSSECVVRNNTCALSGNGGLGAGIHVIGADNRIEANNCLNADRGIDVDGAGNIIIRNTCSGNTVANWDIVANNVVGPILDRTVPASAAILGNSAPSSLGSTDANANFTY